MRSLMLAAVLVVTAAGVATANGPKGAPNPTPGFVPGSAGRLSWAGVPGLGAPAATRAGFNPVVGSVSRTGLFGKRYTGAAYDPALGRFGTYRFRP
ncbi:MAG: hypothetical protein C0501_01435 [Isosphaera sp.]|nr:hypothetical protein [Isosphaera sp.]